jgi:hypothetical protein
MAVNPSQKRKHGHSDCKPHVCWNCGEAGHFCDKCPKMKKAKMSTGSESAHVTQDLDEEAFPISDVDSMPDLELVSNSSELSSSDTNPDSMPDLCTVSDSSDYDSVGGHASFIENDEGKDWFSKVGEHSDSPWGDGWDTEELSGVDSDSSSLVHVDLDLVSEVSQSETFDEPGSLEPEDMATYVSTNCAFTNGIRTELYDSGTTHHISPYREMFENLVDIPLKTFNDINQQKFDAVGKGDMVIEVPNSVNTLKLQLTEVLYSLEVGYMLVLIGRLDENGYLATFVGGKSTICDGNGKTISQVPKSGKGLYKVVHEDSDSSFAAIEKLTVMELHCCMGHISPTIAKKLVNNGLVTGVRLNDSSDNIVFCKYCVYAKATCKPVPKACEGERATEFGGEIHSDLWGPAPVSTICGHPYYVTFTDDKTWVTYLHLLH